jgi:hypothetical protein
MPATTPIDTSDPLRLTHPTHTPLSTPDASASGTSGLTTMGERDGGANEEARRKPWSSRGSRIDVELWAASMHYSLPAPAYMSDHYHTHMHNDSHHHTMPMSTLPTLPLEALSPPPAASSASRPVHPKNTPAVKSFARTPGSDSKSTGRWPSSAKAHDLSNDMPASGHGSGGDSGEGDAAGGVPTGGYGALILGGVCCANLGVLAMGFRDDGHGVVIPTGGLKIRRV